MGYKINKGFMWIREPNIPAEYQEVEYIQGSGTQYIDAGLAVKDGFKIICNTEFVSWGTYMCLGGYLGQSGGIYYRLYGGVSNTGKRAYGFLGNYSDDLGSSSLNTKYKLELHIKSGNNYFKVNDTTMASGTQTFSTSLTGNIGILAGYADDASGKWNKWSAKMYDYKIRDNGGTLIRDYVPCYRKSDNVIGMYDRVEGQFYANAGGGAFTKGNDVPPVSAFNERQFYPGNSSPFTPLTVEYSFPGKNLQTDFVDKGCVAQDYITINSNGLTDSTSSSDRYGRLWIPMEGDLSGASSFSITANLYGQSGSWAGGYYFGATSTTNFDDGTRIGGGINFSNNSGYNGQSLDFDRSAVASTYLTIGTGNYVCTLSVDFNTGLFKHEVTGASSWTLQYTLSESQLNEIKSNLQWIGLQVGHGVYNTKYFTSVSYTIQ